jgi:hypothetical protein
MRRCALFFLTLALAACDRSVGPGSVGHLRFIEQASANAVQPDRSVRRVETITFDLPDGFVVDDSRGTILIDKAGRRFPATKVGLSNSSTGGNRVTASFEVPSDFAGGTIRIDKFDVDFGNSRITWAR